MPRTGDELLSDALQLPIEQRTALADSLYESVESEMGEPDEAERAWLEEARRRLEGLQRGETKLLSVEEVDRRVRTLLHP